MAIKDWSVVLGRPPKAGDEVTVWAFDVDRRGKPVFSVKGTLSERHYPLPRVFHFNASRRCYYSAGRFEPSQPARESAYFATREQAAIAWRTCVVRDTGSVAAGCREDAARVDREVRWYHKTLERAYEDVIAKRAALIEHGASPKQLELFERHVAKLRSYERSVLPAISGELAQLRDKALKPICNASGARTGRSSAIAHPFDAKRAKAKPAPKAPKRGTRAAKRA